MKTKTKTKAEVVYQYAMFTIKLMGLRNQLTEEQYQDLKELLDFCAEGLKVQASKK